MIKLNTITNNYAQLDDNQLVKLVQYENYDALAELWKRHADYIKKVTLGQYYKIRPDFSEDARDSEKLSILLKRPRQKRMQCQNRPFPNPKSSRTLQSRFRL